MPIWTNQLPANGNEQSLPIRRTPATKTLKAIITSEDLLGTYTHFYRGRTAPCERPDCEACKAGQPWRYHAYVACYDPLSNLHFIFEMTAQAAEHLVKHRDANRGLRGAQIEAYRWGKRANGRVILKCGLGAIPVNALPSPPDLVKCLSILWNIPLPQLETKGRLKKSKRIAIDKTPLPDGNGRNAP